MGFLDGMSLDVMPEFAGSDDTFTNYTGDYRLSNMYESSGMPTETYTYSTDTGIDPYVTGGTPPQTDTSTSFWSKLGSSLLDPKMLATLGTVGLGTYGAVAGSGAVSDASKRAAELQQATSLAQISELKRQYDQTRSDFEPYRAVGTQGLAKLQQRNYSPSAGYNPSQFVPRPGQEMPNPQMSGLSEETANSLMGQQNLTDDQVLMASLKGRLGMR
jgi:hypothetical protein